MLHLNIKGRYRLSNDGVIAKSITSAFKSCKDEIMRSTWSAPPRVAQELHWRVISLKLPVPGFLDEIALNHGAGSERVTGQTANDAPHQPRIGVQPAKQPCHTIIIGDLIAQ